MTTLRLVPEPVKTIFDPPKPYDIAAIEHANPGFLARVDGAIRQLYHLRQIDEALPAGATNARHSLTEMVRELTEPFDEWFFQTRQRPGGVFDAQRKLT